MGSVMCRNAGGSGSPESSRAAAWLVFAVLLCSYGYFFQGGGWNANARLDLTRALAERHTIVIDAYRHNTGDWAFRDGHYYANKAPGLSWLSAPFFRAAGPVARSLFPDDAPKILLVQAYLTNLAVNAVPSAWLGVLLFQVLHRLGLGDTARRAWASLAFGLGTLAFPYATAYYAHQLAATLGFAAFAALLAARARPAGGRYALLAGAAAGAAVLVETSSALTALILALAGLSDARGRALLPAFVLGGLPMAVGLALYNDAAFGNPLASSLAYSNPEVVTRVGGSLFGLPSLDRIARMLGGPHRGLLFTSPVLVLAPLGWASLRRANARSAWICLAVPLAFIGLIASFHAWRGGWASGPRYLIPCLPFLFVPVAFAMPRARVLAGGLAALSVAIMLSITAVAVEIPTFVRNPLFGFVLPQLADGHVSVNPIGFDDAGGAPGYGLSQWPENWSAFNLGELAWPHSTWSLLPLLAVWAGLGWLLVRGARGSPIDRELGS
jgi:hypothetical protein